MFKKKKNGGRATSKRKRRKKGGQHRVLSTRTCGRPRVYMLLKDLRLIIHIATCRQMQVIVTMILYGYIDTNMINKGNRDEIIEKTNM